MPHATSRPLWMRVGELAPYSASCLYLADVASDRLSMTQVAFFMLAATSDLAGRPATRTALINAYPDMMRGSIRNSYRQLMVPSRMYPKALGWLIGERNPDDDREQFLRLTAEGRSVLEGVMLTLEPILPPGLSERSH